MFVFSPVFLIHSLNSLFIFLFEREIVGLDETMPGMFCTRESNINRTNDLAENHRGHMPHGPGPAACGPLASELRTAWQAAGGPRLSRACV